jgi:hypothetical protein
LSRHPAATIIENFADLDEPRRYNKRHLLIDIIVIAICAVICGADDWEAIEECGKDKQDWFARFLELPHGIPSHDTFRRVFAVLDAEQFRTCFIEWIKAVHEITDGQIVPPGKAPDNIWDSLQPLPTSQLQRTTSPH